MKLAATQMPEHTHSVKASGSAAASDSPEGRAMARSSSHIYHDPDTKTVMSAKMLGDAGGSEPHDNIQPYLVLNFCIALTGIFPSQS